MINPNKSYKSNRLARIVKIEEENSYIPYIYIETLDGNHKLEGDLKQCHNQWKQLKVGDVVGFTGRFSITADKFMIDALTRKRKLV